MRLCLCVTVLAVALGICPVIELLAGNWHLHSPLWLPNPAFLFFRLPASRGSTCLVLQETILINSRLCSLAVKGQTQDLVRVYFSHILYEGLQVVTALLQVQSSVTKITTEKLLNTCTCSMLVFTVLRSTIFLSGLQNSVENIRKQGKASSVHRWNIYSALPIGIAADGFFPSTFFFFFRSKHNSLLLMSWNPFLSKTFVSGLKLNFYMDFAGVNFAKFLRYALLLLLSMSHYIKEIGKWNWNWRIFCSGLLRIRNKVDDSELPQQELFCVLLLIQWTGILVAAVGISLLTPITTQNVVSDCDFMHSFPIAFLFFLLCLLTYSKGSLPHIFIYPDIFAMLSAAFLESSKLLDYSVENWKKVMNPQHWKLQLFSLHCL